MSAPTVSRADRHQAAKRLRGAWPREAHAELDLPRGRDALSILLAQDVSRIASLVPERHRRMLENPFAFFRGAAAIMAADLMPLQKPGLTVQASGDCHLMNFGAFVSPEAHILFDLNDFDETFAGVDFTVDVKRLAASIAIAAHDFGIGPKRAHAIVRRAVRAYREFMRELARLSPLAIWHQRILLDVELERIDDRRLRRVIRRGLIKAAAKIEADDEVPHLDLSGRSARFQDRDGKIHHGDDETAHLLAEASDALGTYPQTLQPDRRQLIERYSLVDTAIKVVGVGSVGTLCAIGLYTTADNDRLVLQIKEAKPSVIADLAEAPTAIEDDGRRVVEGQRALQAASDVFLGWMPETLSGRHFYVRQLKNQRLASLGDLIAEEIEDGAALAAYADLCARTLARAHARSGDPVAIGGYLGSGAAFDDAIAEFANAYVDVNRKDYAALAGYAAGTGSSRQG
ncbi:MAG: DUF2252 domain-containing protein [Ancalomicrobiaceae bacterium]|nr:DUF2252 domain-containing protein [Ancalomicrobiaceae bacterium]